MYKYTKQNSPHLNGWQRFVLNYPWHVWILGMIVGGLIGYSFYDVLVFMESGR